MSVRGVNATDSLYNYGNDLLNDQYFLQALQSPNYYSAVQTPQVPQLPQVSQVDTTTTNQAVDSLKNVNFTGASDAITEKQEEKKSSAAGWLLTAIGTVLTGIAAWKCHGKGAGKEWYTKMWNGAKKYWNNGLDYIRDNVPKLKFKIERLRNSKGQFISNK